MSTCPDCRYCAPTATGPATRRWPRPARWFDQPCVHCSHRLKAHEAGVPGVHEDSDLERALAPGTGR